MARGRKKSENGKGKTLATQQSVNQAASGMRNFDELYCSIVDEWALYDNSGAVPALLREGVNDER